MGIIKNKVPLKHLAIDDEVAADIYKNEDGRKVVKSILGEEFRK